MNFLRTLILAVLVAGFGAYIYFVEQPRVREEAAGDRVADFQVADVGALTLTYPDKLVLHVERGATDWVLTQPIHAHADQSQVNRLLRAIHDAKVDRRVDAKQVKPLKTYGLDGNGTRARIDIKTKAGKALPAIIVGNTTPVGYQAFVRVEGRDDLLITPLLFHSGIKKTVYDLRDKKLFTVDLGDAVGVTLTRGDKQMVFQRDGVEWKIIKPNRHRADKTEVDGLVQALNQLQATAFVDPDKADARGLDKPWLDFEVDLGKAGTVGFVAGDENNDRGKGYYIRRKSDRQIAKVPAWIKTRFDRDESAFRDRSLFDCVRGEVSRVNVQRADSEPFSLVRDSQGHWTIEPNPDDVRVRQGVAAKKIDDLTAFKPQTLVADDVSDDRLPGYGLAPAAIELELADDDGKMCGAAAVGVVAGADGKSAYYFRRSDKRSVLSAPQYLFSHVDLRKEDLVTKPPGPAAKVDEPDGPAGSPAK